MSEEASFVLAVMVAFGFDYERTKTTLLSECRKKKPHAGKER